MSFDDDQKNAVVHADNANTVTSDRPRKRGVWGFIKAFWWAFLIAFVLVTLLIVLLIIYVAIPKIAQQKLDEATLTIEGISVLQSQPSSVYTSINSTISSNSGISATFDGFNASLYLEDKLPHTPFAYLQMPQTSAGSAVAVNVSQLLNIYDLQAYTDYNTWFLLNDTFRMSISGSTKVHIGSLPAYNVNFLKTVTLTGLNGFKGLNVTSSAVTLIPDAQGDNFKGYITIPNPSVLTVDIGNATFNQLFNGTSVGHSYIDNMVLYPGNNNLSIRANITQAPILIAVESLPYCANGGILPMSFAGESVINNGQHLSYYEAGFQQNVETLDLNVGADLHDGLGLNITCPPTTA